jgi:hypothetical protein
MTVYVLQCQQTRNIKIGYTARMVQDRLKELKTASSTPLELVKWYPGLTQSHEQHLHATLGQYRVTGEWFKHDALHMVDNAAESLFTTGERDFTGTCQGKAVSVQTASISIAVLKLNGQNLKKSVVDQLPRAEFKDIFWIDKEHAECSFADNVKAWGWLCFNFKDTDKVILEKDGILSRHSLCSVGHKSSYYVNENKKSFFEGLYNLSHVSQREGEIVLPLGNGKARYLNDAENQLFDSYMELIESLPQLFLA